MAYHLAIYEISRAYGGPEEGGWYFDTGHLVRPLAIVRDYDRACALAMRLNGWLDRLQSSGRSVSSVAYAGGCYAVEFGDNGEVPASYPATRPHYE